MLKRNFLIAFRNFYRNKLFSIINILGLSLSIGVFLLILLYVSKEFQGDKFHKNYENLARLDRGDKVGTPIPLVNHFGSNFPEISSYVRLSRMWDPVISTNEHFLTIEKGYFCDTTVLDILTINNLEGNLKATLKQPFQMVISDKVAQKLFGNDDPIGKVIKYNNQFEFTIGGIFESLPSNSHLKIEVLSNIDNMPKMSEIEKYPYESFHQWGCITYLLLNENVDFIDFNNKLNGFIKDVFPGDANLHAQSFKSIYFDYASGKDIEKHANSNILYVLLSIAILIIAIASINFLNLSTARASTRFKEIGVKKVVGATKRMLVIQFLFESIILCYLSLVLGFLFAELINPYIRNLIYYDLNINYFLTGMNPVYFLLGSLILGLISGLYPALYLSSLPSVKILKGPSHLSFSKGKIFRKLLITFQFTVSIIIILGAFTIQYQLGYLKNADLGFAKNNLIYIPYNDAESTNNGEIFVQEMLKDENIIGISQTNTIPGKYFSQNICEVDGEKKILYDLIADSKYFDVMSLNVIKGKLPEPDMPPTNGIILNETAVKYLNWEDPIGRKDIWGIPVIGVIEDFHFQSLHNDVLPLMIRFHKYYEYASIRIPPEGIQKSINNIQKKWEEINPNSMFEFHFLDASFDELYQTDQRLGMLINYFSLFAVLISCTGLIGLMAFTIERRVKEIGIRKAHGAKITSIIFMLFNQYTPLMIISFIVGIPISIKLMNKWLASFAFQVHIPVWIVLLACISLVLITFVSIGFQSYKAARTNPVKALRYE